MKLNNEPVCIELKNGTVHESLWGSISSELVSAKSTPAAAVSWQGRVKKMWQPISKTVPEQRVVVQPIAHDQEYPSAGVVQQNLSTSNGLNAHQVEGQTMGAELLQISSALPQVQLIQDCEESSSGGPTELQLVQNSPATVHMRTDQIRMLEDTTLQHPLPLPLPSPDVVHPRSADSALGKKKAPLNVRQLGFQEMSLLQQKETAASIMVDFYQWKVTTDLEEEVRKEFVVQEEPGSEKGWQVVRHKKKRSSDAHSTPKEPHLSSKATSHLESSKVRHKSKAWGDSSLDPEYKIEQLHARIQKMKRDSPQKRQLQSELKILRGA